MCTADTQGSLPVRSGSGLDGRCQRRDVRCFLSYVESVSACCHSSPWKLRSESYCHWEQQGTTQRKRFERDCNSSWSRASLYVSSPGTWTFSNSVAPLTDYREEGGKRYPERLIPKKIWWGVDPGKLIFLAWIYSLWNQCLANAGVLKVRICHLIKAGWECVLGAATGGWTHTRQAVSVSSSGDASRILLALNWRLLTVGVFGGMCLFHIVHERAFVWHCDHIWTREWVQIAASLC